MNFMPAVGAHPIITIAVLFIVFFAIFFLVIYGLLQYFEQRKGGRAAVAVGQANEIPTFARYKTCSNCGTSMPGIASFCPECGAAQVPAQRQ